MLPLLRGAFLLLLVPMVLAAECLKEAEAAKILKRYVSIFQKITPNAVATTIAPNIDFFSDSLDFLYGNPLPGSISGQPFWKNRAQFIEGQNYAQEQRKNTTTNFKFQVLQYRYSCDSITFHWRGDGESKAGIPGSTNQEGDPVGIAGIDMLFLNTNVSPKKIKTVYSEFNLGEVLYTSGQKVCFQKENADACTCPANTDRRFK